ncbi:MAG: hypothetical protein J5854_02070 [Clostridia bacterium]|nr:hypothetical protein [Clostridia bacterium]
MFGYISPFIPELKVKDRDLYNAYYCGLCRALSKYGFNSRLTLSYDASFAAILIAGAAGLEPDVRSRGCAVHPARGKTPVVADDGALDFASALSVLLAKYKLIDDARDGRPMRKGLLPAFRRGVKKAETDYPETANIIKEGLDALGAIEAAPECDPDAAPNSFGETLGLLLASCPVLGDEAKPLVREVGRKLGGYIYVLDALDDMKADGKRGNYNIFLRSKIADPLATGEATADMYINAAVLAYDLLDIKVNKPILDNIMYTGLGARAAEVLDRLKAEREEKEETL